MARRRWRPNQAIPQTGLIAGGRLAGWRYGFRRFQRNARGQVDVVAFCTPPHWPFGREIVCIWSLAHRFTAVPGERAKRLSVNPLIEAALQAMPSEGS
jgi:hypothetical protein